MAEIGQREAGGLWVGHRALRILPGLGLDDEVGGPQPKFYCTQVSSPEVPTSGKGTLPSTLHFLSLKIECIT